LASETIERCAAASKINPRPDHGEETYRGSGRLANRKGVDHGGDSGMGRAAAIAYDHQGCRTRCGGHPGRPSQRGILQAEMLGVRRSSVSLVAGTLQKARFIKYRRGEILLLDIEQIEAGACECHPACYLLALDCGLLAPTPSFLRTP
jgi:hypothetical protein